MIYAIENLRKSKYCTLFNLNDLVQNKFLNSCKLQMQVIKKLPNIEIIYWFKRWHHNQLSLHEFDMCDFEFIDKTRDVNLSDVNLLYTIFFVYYSLFLFAYISKLTETKLMPQVFWIQVSRMVAVILNSAFFLVMNISGWCFQDEYFCFENMDLCFLGKFWTGCKWARHFESTQFRTHSIWPLSSRCYCIMWVLIHGI